MPILQKINRVMQLVHGVEKGSKNSHGGYAYAGHDAVTSALRDHFASLGIVRSASMDECKVLDGGAVFVKVTVSYLDAEDQSSHAVSMFAVQHAQTSKGSITAQQVGQALSYAVKNVEFKLFALTGDPERDGDQDETHWSAQSPQQQQAPVADGAQGVRISGGGVVSDLELTEEERATLARGGKRLGEALLARSLLEAFDKAATVDEVGAANDACKAAWSKISGVPGIAEAVTAQKKNAYARLKGAK